MSGEVSGGISKMLSILERRPTEDLAEMAGELVGKGHGTPQQRKRLLKLAKNSDPQIQEAFLQGAENGNAAKMKRQKP